MRALDRTMAANLRVMLIYREICSTLKVRNSRKEDAFIATEEN
jgi:hypothetical protein